MVDVHTPGAPGHPPAFLQAVELALAGVVGLALHEVIVVLAASGADEKGRREKRRRADTELLDLGDRVRERGGVVEDLLVETARNVSQRCSLMAGWKRGKTIQLACDYSRKRGGTYTGFRAAIVSVGAGLLSIEA